MRGSEMVLPRPGRGSWILHKRGGKSRGWSWGPGAFRPWGPPSIRPDDLGGETPTLTLPRKREREERSRPSLKGGDPAAGSPTATLLRLHPSHQPRLGRLRPLRVGSTSSAGVNFHGVTGGVYKARERIHRAMLLRDY